MYSSLKQLSLQIRFLFYDLGWRRWVALFLIHPRICVSPSRECLRTDWTYDILGFKSIPILRLICWSRVCIESSLGEWSVLSRKEIRYSITQFGVFIEQKSLELYIQSESLCSWSWKVLIFQSLNINDALKWDYNTNRSDPSHEICFSSELWIKRKC